jgi:hypothetical protein
VDGQKKTASIWKPFSFQMAGLIICDSLEVNRHFPNSFFDFFVGSFCRRIDSWRYMEGNAKSVVAYGHILCGRMLQKLFGAPQRTET